MMDSILNSQRLGAASCRTLLERARTILSHLLQRGTSQPSVRSVAAYLIHIIRLMK